MFSTNAETIKLINENPACSVFVKAGWLGWVKVDREEFLDTLEQVGHLQIGDYHTRLIIDIIFVEKVN